MFQGLEKHSINRHDLTPMDTSKFWVVTCISNVRRYRSRYNLYRKFAKHCRDSGVNLFTVEVAFGDRPFEITASDNPHHLQLRTWSELWHKENMLNLAVQRLPQDWEYVAWVDADIQFARPDWAHETVQQLQHHMIVQMWSIAQDLGPDLEPFRSYRSFCSCYLEHIRMEFTEDILEVNVHEGGTMGPMHLNVEKRRVDLKTPDPYYSGTELRPFWHSGYAWAARREAFDHLGGLIDWAILGAADHHMALCLIGEGANSIRSGIGTHYYEKVMEWQARCETYIKRDIGFVPGAIFHYWHGNKANRRYNTRWKILQRHNYNPIVDIKRDSNGLWQLTDRCMGLRDELRFYMAQRNEDASDLILE